MTIDIEERSAHKRLMLKYIVAPLALLLAAGCTPQLLPGSPEYAERSPNIASRNGEFRAKQDGTGCAPRAHAEYAALRRTADGLEAEVTASKEPDTATQATPCVLT